MTIKKILLTALLLANSLLLQAALKVQSVSTIEQINKANEQLKQASQDQKKSRQLIIDANLVRKQLKKIRASKISNNQDSISQAEKETKILDLVKQLEQKQKEGANLREKSANLKRLAADNFEEGFVQRWKNKVTNRQPLTMDNEVENYFAHNTRIRSVHKNMPTNQTTSDQDLQVRADMSLQIPALMKQNAPPDLNIKAFKFSRKERYFAHIEVHTTEEQSDLIAKNATNVSAVPLNKIHQWRLMVTDLSGNPAENIQFTIEGHMPGHVHGLPTAPRITREVEPGIYIVDGMKFQMKGWWVMKFILQPDDDKNSNLKQADFFTFNLVL